MPCVFPILSLKLLGIAVSVHRAEERRHGARLCRGRGHQLRRARRAPAGAAGRRRRDRLGVPAAIAGRRRAARLSAVRDGAEPVRGRRIRRRAGRDRQPLRRAHRTGRRLRDRRPGDDRRDPVHRAVHGHRARLCDARAAPSEALAVFVALGAGLAAPVVLATAVPGIARLLPRPGPWMLWFKQLLAFPLYATVAWLIWVLMQQIAPGRRVSRAARPGAGRLRGVDLWPHALRRAGRTAARARRRRDRARRLARRRGDAGAGRRRPPRPARGTATASPTRASAPARLDRLVAERTPVFVNLTAAWCITCLVNERTLDSDTVRRAFAAHEIVPLKGDWTRQDPEITALPAEIRPQRRAALPALRPRPARRRAAADPDRGDDPRRDRPDLSRRKRAALSAL